MGKPTIPNLEAYFQIGMDPNTKLPMRYSDVTKLEDGIRRQLQIVDEQDAINRYTWFNLPNGIDGQLLERILYYRYKGMLFYMETDDKFYFLPYTLDGSIDVYGRYTGVAPVAFNGKTADSEDKPWIPGLSFKPVYDIADSDEVDGTEVCVLLTDYCQPIGQQNLARKDIQQPVIDYMSEIFPMSRTALISNCGVRGVRVPDEDAQPQVDAANRAVANAAKVGKPWVPMTAALEFQELGGESALKSEEFLIMMQALDNYRLSLLGLKNGGLFQKKSHMLESEQEMNNGETLLTELDGLIIRQRFCDLVNAVWGLGIWCESTNTMNEMSMAMPPMGGEQNVNEQE